MGERLGMKCGMLGRWQKDRQPLALIGEADTCASSLFGLRAHAQHNGYPAKTKRASKLVFIISCEEL